MSSTTNTQLGVIETATIADAILTEPVNTFQFEAIGPDAGIDELSGAKIKFAWNNRTFQVDARTRQELRVSSDVQSLLRYAPEADIWFNRFFDADDKVTKKSKRVGKAKIADELGVKIDVKISEPDADDETDDGVIRLTNKSERVQYDVRCLYTTFDLMQCLSYHFPREQLVSRTERQVGKCQASLAKIGRFVRALKSDKSAYFATSDYTDRKKILDQIQADLNNPTMAVADFSSKWVKDAKVKDAEPDAPLKIASVKDLLLALKIECKDDTSQTGYNMIVSSLQAQGKVKASDVDALKFESKVIGQIESITDANMSVAAG